MATIVPTLEEVIQDPVFQGDEQLLSLLKEAEQIDKSILWVNNILGRCLLYVSPDSLSITGYTANELLAGGPDAIFNMALPETIPSIIQKQIDYIKFIKREDFDPRALLIIEFDGKIKKMDGGHSNFLCLGTALTFSLSADFEYCIQVMMMDYDESSIDRFEVCKNLIERIKIRHNEIFTHPKLNPSQKHLNPIYITTKSIDHQITTREIEVLRSLASGLSTKEIAVTLQITCNTVESHRKNLLEKFDAKNSAELIKKASKVFWLE